MPLDTLLQNCRLADGSQASIGIAAGRIASIHQGEAPAAASSIDCGGDLLLPALVDGHMHHDKTLMGLPWMDHAAEPYRMSRILTDQRLLPNLPLDAAGRAGALIRRCVAFGTGHMRTHADIVPELGLAPLHGVLAARDAHAHAVTVQVVAFPQAGIMRSKGAAELMDAALREGADLVGGIDPCEVDRDIAGHLKVVFDLAEKHGKGIDIHLHEPGELGLFSLQEIAARTKAQGMQGKVTISHGFGLGGIAESKQQAAAAMMAEAGLSLVSHGAGGATLPPLWLLRQHGVRVFCGNDDIHDTWSPYGNGDMLERACTIGWRVDVRKDADLNTLFAMCSSEGAAALGVEHGIAIGMPANCFTIPAETVAEAVGQHAPRRLVFFNGRLVARDGAFCA